MLQQIIEVCVIPLVIVLSKYFIRFVNKKSEEVENGKIKNYTDIAAKVITDCVTYTNQTYVDALKKNKTFTEEAKNEAFNKSYENVLLILGESAKAVLRQVYGDLEAYLETEIEAEVKRCKHENQVQ